MSNDQMLLGELREFKRSSIAFQKEVKTDIGDVNKKLDFLMKRHWKTVGFTSALMLLVEIIAHALSRGVAG